MIIFLLDLAPFYKTIADNFRKYSSEESNLIWDLLEAINMKEQHGSSCFCFGR